MQIPGFFKSDSVQAGVFGVGVEGGNMLAQNALEMGSPHFGEAFGYVKGAVDGILDMTGANSLMAANPAITSLIAAGGAGLLSNKVLKDIGLNDDTKSITSIKNLTRYALNAGAMLGTYSAGTAAAPYLIAGAGAYFAGKYGWKASASVAKLLGEGVKRIGKAGLNTVTGAVNGAGHTLVDPFIGIYDGLVKNDLAKPQLAPAYAK